MPARYGLVPFFRFVARQSLLYVGIAYTLCLTVAAIIDDLTLESAGQEGTWPAWALRVLAFSVLFTVVTWYRDDDTISAAFLIVALTGIGFLAAMALASLVLTGSPAMLLVAAATGFVALVLRLIILVPVTVLLIWIGRRLRRFFAPATLDDERLYS